MIQIIVFFLTILSSVFCWANRCSDIFTQESYISEKHDGIEIRFYQHSLSRGVVLKNNPAIIVEMSTGNIIFEGRILEMESESNPLKEGAKLSAPVGYNWVLQPRDIDSNKWNFQLQRVSQDLDQSGPGAEIISLNKRRTQVKPSRALAIPVPVETIQEGMLVKFAQNPGAGERQGRILDNFEASMRSSESPSKGLKGTLELWGLRDIKKELINVMFLDSVRKYLATANVIAKNKEGYYIIVHFDARAFRISVGRYARDPAENDEVSGVGVAGFRPLKGSILGKSVNAQARDYFERLGIGESFINRYAENNLWLMPYSVKGEFGDFLFAQLVVPVEGGLSLSKILQEFAE